MKVADVLAHYGKDVSQSRLGLIRSPFRDERTPSFHILPNGYAWKDFGDGSGGGVIDLVMRLENCDREAAIVRLREMRNSGAVFSAAPVRERRQSQAVRTTLSVYSVDPVRSEAFTSYAASRGISPELLSTYCREVTVRKGRSFNSFIGFPNSDGGYVLRSPLPGNDGKRCTSAYPTFIDTSGAMCGSGSAVRVAVFEGFFDFLSLLQMSGRMLPESDVCVLNSVNNLAKALPFILSHGYVELYLDNDAAGRKASEEIRLAVLSAETPGRVEDLSHLYRDYNDVNDYLKSKGNTPLNISSYGNTREQELREEGDHLP
ncbi:MAG: toprim domain-containing protein [Candidatus Cryptobacteroides sp.]